MRAIRVIGLLILALGLTLFTRNNAHAIGRRAHPLLAAFQMQAAPGSQLTILAPKPGQKVPGDTVTIQFQLQRTATVQSVPTFQIRLDANDVIQTADTSYTFSGVQPGAHTVTIQCVDANGVPVPNAANQIQFTVVQQTAAVNEEDSAEASAFPANPGNGSLSMLGVVGFGVLVGGALSLYRNRSSEPIEENESEK